MTSPARSTLSAVGGRFLQLRRYLRVAVLFMRSDPWMTIYPGTAFAVAAAHHAHLAPTAFALAIAKAALYMTGFLALHAISSQLVSVEEDRINKPWRPIPSGLISEAAARNARDAVLVLFPLLGLGFDVLVWALLWEVVVLSDAHTKWVDRHPVCKNLYTAASTLAGWAACWQIVAPLNEGAWRFILVLSACVLLTIHIQDLRDIDGDRQAARRTAPLVWGEKRTRVTLAVSIAVLPVVTFMLNDPLGHDWPVRAAWAGSSILALAAAFHLLTRTGKAANQRAYRMWEQWLTAALACAILVI